MKWFFALNAPSLQGRRDFWEHMMLAAVASAKENTNLVPHLVWDGADDPFLDRLRGLDVVVVPHRVTFYDALAAHAADRKDPHWGTVATGAFLRTELALLSQDELVLYTDCDVLFTAPFCAPFSPAVFACAPEFTRGDPQQMNTGVMLMNLPALRETLPAFQDFIRAHLGDFETLDQDAYRQFYGDVAEVLPDTYNWKPYWGTSPDALVVHFHGPKPSWIRQQLASEETAAVPTMSELLARNIPAYVHYTDRWAMAARSVGAELS